ncbi:MAG: hypothetical protein HFG05_10055 [Oscillibacter sp.]|nr:hypothetical protein [Oscillibacter sp.]
MIPRMTTVGTLKNYRYDLNRSNNTMNKAMNTVLTRRLFNSYGEDPALATRCFQIRHSYWRANSQLNVNESLRHKYDVAWEATGSMSTDLYAQAEDTAYTSVIRALNRPTGPGRVALGQSLEAKAKDLAQIMNGRYGENYVFGGADTLNAPFTWDPLKNPDYIDPEVAQEKLADPNISAEDLAKYSGTFQYVDANGELTNDVTKADEEYVINPKWDDTLNPGDPDYQPKYIGKDGNPTDVEADAQTKPKENPLYNEKVAFKYLKADGTGTNVKNEAKQALHYRGVPVDSNAPADVEKMEYFLNGESKYIDVGLGHKEDKGEAVSSTVFDSALQGIYYTGGYGTKNGVEVEIEDENGHTEKMTVDNIPQNVISVVHEMGEILQRCNKEDGSWASKEDQFRFKALVDEFEEGCASFRERWTEMDTQTGFLRDNSELLTDTSYSLQQQYMELEDADPAAAISDFMFARYCFDAALKVGNSVLSQSLMDYMSF